MGSNKTKTFTDDIVIWGEDEMEVHEKVTELNQVIKEYGMQISVKSNVVVMTREMVEGILK